MLFLTRHGVASSMSRALRRASAQPSTRGSGQLQNPKLRVVDKKPLTERLETCARPPCDLLGLQKGRKSVAESQSPIFKAKGQEHTYQQPHLLVSIIAVDSSQTEVRAWSYLI